MYKDRCCSDVMIMHKNREGIIIIKCNNHAACIRVVIITVKTRELHCRDIVMRAICILPRKRE